MKFNPCYATDSRYSNYAFTVSKNLRILKCAIKLILSINRKPCYDNWQSYNSHLRTIAVDYHYLMIFI